MKINIPSDATLGAEIRDIDLANLSEIDFAAIYELWLERGVLVFTEVHLSEHEHIAFSRRFGRLEKTLSKRTAKPEISLLSNVKKDGSVAKSDDSLGLFLKGNQYWHSDSSFKLVSAKASLLRALEVPSEGGDTEWADMRSGYDTLTPSEQDRLDGLTAVHSYSYSQGLVGGLSLLNEREIAALPPVRHPIVKTHSETKRKSLFLGRHIEAIEGMTYKASQAFLASLINRVCRTPRVYRYTWKAGDLAIWDNRCILHRGHPWPSDQRRVMRRTTVAGEGENPWAITEDSRTRAVMA